MKLNRNLTATIVPLRLKANCIHLGIKNYNIYHHWHCYFQPHVWYLRSPELWLIKFGATLLSADSDFYHIGNNIWKCILILLNHTHRCSVVDVMSRCQHGTHLIETKIYYSSTPKAKRLTRDAKSGTLVLIVGCLCATFWVWAFITFCCLYNYHRCVNFWASLAHN